MGEMLFVTYLIQVVNQESCCCRETARCHCEIRSLYGMCRQYCCFPL